MLLIVGASVRLVSSNISQAQVTYAFPIPFRALFIGLGLVICKVFSFEQVTPQWKPSTIQVMVTPLHKAVRAGQGTVLEAFGTNRQHNPQTSRIHVQAWHRWLITITVHHTAMCLSCKDRRAGGPPTHPQAPGALIGRLYVSGAKTQQASRWTWEDAPLHRLLLSTQGEGTIKVCLCVCVFWRHDNAGP